MEEWKTYTLGELSVDGKGSYGIGAPAVEYSPDKYTYLRITDINDDGTLAASDRKSVDAEGAENYILKENDIVFARTGNSTGRAYFYDSRDGELVYAGFLIKFSLDPNKVNPKILKYYTHSKPYYDWVRSFDSGATRGNINAQTFASMPIELPSRTTQDRIVDIMSAIDDKIRNNNRINHNLEQQAQALYKSWFVDFEPFKGGKFVDSELGMIPEGWSVQKAEELCEINIGKTPPRKEHHWFSNNNSDVTWISISDMGSSEVYISKSSEMLTKEACKKFNVIIVPEGTVLLSFKLTVGRVSIAAKELTTNEAIARFLVPTDAMRSYLYLALKSYDYSKLGSTSSIATAVNSKIIKKMALICPPEDIIEKFGVHVSGIFRSIKTFQEEISCLCEQRDSLLPRLMSGEITC